MGYFNVSLVYISMYFLGVLVILSKEHKVVIVNTCVLGNSKCFWSTGLSVTTLNEEKKGRWSNTDLYDSLCLQDKDLIQN